MRFNFAIIDPNYRAPGQPSAEVRSSGARRAAVVYLDVKVSRTPISPIFARQTVQPRPPTLRLTGRLMPGKKDAAYWASRRVENEKKQKVADSGQL